MDMQRKSYTAWAGARKHPAAAVLVLAALLGLAALGLAVFLRPGLAWPAWTGFGPTVGADGKVQPGKTLWDWMQLLIVPLALTLAAFFFNRQEKEMDESRQVMERNRERITALRERKREARAAAKEHEKERKIEDFNREEGILRWYLDKMSELILDPDFMKINAAAAEIYPENASETARRIDNLLTDTQRGMRTIAQIWTITALRQLKDPARRNTICQFLRDANLKNFVLESADLFNFDLSDTNLAAFNLSHAAFGLANLSGARFHKALLIDADLSTASFDGAEFSQANLLAARIDDWQLEHVRGSLDGATLPDGKTYHPQQAEDVFSDSLSPINRYRTWKARHPQNRAAVGSGD